MDLRIARTRKSIINAFIQLRASKPLEKITVKELSELACINKATFYSHYPDIFDLSEQLEEEAIQSVLAAIPHPEYVTSNQYCFVQELAFSLFSQNELFHILFSGSRSHHFISKLEIALKEQIYAAYPHKKNSLEMDLFLSFLIQGCFHAFFSHQEEDLDTVIRILSQIDQCLVKNYSFTEPDAPSSSHEQTAPSRLL